MSELIYYLKPKGVNDGSLIEIPVGKITIGRGPFLRCTEKRVSRNHAELTLTVDGDLSITAKHVNPIYHCDNAISSVYQPLEKEKLHVLKPGNSFSLLPGLLIYEIIVKPKSGRMSTSLNENKAEDFTLAANSEAEKMKTFVEAKNFEGDVERKNEVSIEETKTRNLPDWLIEMAENVPLGKNADSSIKNSKKNLKVEKVSENNIPVSQNTKNFKKQNYNFGDVEQEENSSVVSNTNPEVVNAGASAILKGNRSICEYGENCYRKNPNHKSQYSHPGDDDYIQVLKDVSDDDDRPECEFGTNCYRKNPDHKQKFKHSAKPKRKAVIKAKRRKENEAGNEDDDNDEYDESFIDDSDEYDPKKDDANYSSDDDDIESLNKEAKAFIKNKKL